MYELNGYYVSAANIIEYAVYQPVPYNTETRLQSIYNSLPSHLACWTCASRRLRSVTDMPCVNFSIKDPGSSVACSDLLVYSSLCIYH